MLKNSWTYFKNPVVFKVRSLRYVWLFFNILHERVNSYLFTAFVFICSATRASNIREHTYEEMGLAAPPKICQLYDASVPKPGRLEYSNSPSTLLKLESNRIYFFFVQYKGFLPDSQYYKILSSKSLCLFNNEVNNHKT